MGKKSEARRAWRVARVQADPRCDYCGETTSEEVAESHPRRATVEDVIPLSKGGMNNQSNWALACNHCNRLKGDNLTIQPRLSREERTAARMDAKPIGRKHAEIVSKRIHKRQEAERKLRLARLPFTLYTPIPGVPDEAFR